VWRHNLFAVSEALADQQRAHQAGDTGVDVHDSAAGEIDRAPDEDLTSIGHNFIKLSLRSSFGCTIGCSGNRLRCIGDRVRTGPVPDHMRDREVHERHPQRNEQHHR